MYFKYSAVDGEGKIKNGSLTAESTQDAIFQLRSQGLSVMTIKETAEKQKVTSWKQIEILEPDVHDIKLSKKVLQGMAQRMAIMMRAGVTLGNAFDVLVESEKNARVKKVYRSVAKELYLGVSLSDAMSKHKAFPEIMISMIVSGEQNGQLDWAFLKISEMYERQLSLTAKVKSAVGYPLFLVVLLVALIVLMNIVIIPKFSDMFKAMNTTPPLITRIVISASEFLKQYGVLLLAIIAGIIGLYILAKKKIPAFRSATDRLKLKIPAFGTMFRQTAAASFCRVSSSLIESGVEIIESMRIANSVIDNYYIRSMIGDIVDKVQMGSTLAAALGKAQIFDSLFTSMLRIGEKSSTVGETFTKLAEMYEDQSEETTQRVTALMEPIMTLSIGLVVGIVVAAIIIPMFSIYNSVA